MSDKAVFLDRDNTLINDPGYLADPAGVRLLPGVELALKSLAGAGYKLVLVTNQSGVARGLLTESKLKEIHAELARQLGLHDASLDGIYYCPYHPEGTVEPYISESDERKPRPGMILRAVKEMGLDLAASWMVGDSPRDIEAGQRAGCRTIRVRSHAELPHHDAPPPDEDVQADFTVRNLVDAARVIVREPDIPTAGCKAEPELVSAKLNLPAVPVPVPVPVLAAAKSPSRTPEPAPRPIEAPADRGTDSEVLGELLEHVRQLARRAGGRDFSITKLFAGIWQGLAIVSLLVGVVHFAGVASMATETGAYRVGMAWTVAGGVLQLMALTFFVMFRND